MVLCNRHWKQILAGGCCCSWPENTVLHCCSCCLDIWTLQAVYNYHVYHFVFNYSIKPYVITAENMYLFVCVVTLLNQRGLKTKKHLGINVQRAMLLCIVLFCSLFLFFSGVSHRCAEPQRKHFCWSVTETELWRQSFKVCKFPGIDQGLPLAEQKSITE